MHSVLLLSVGIVGREREREGERGVSEMSWGAASVQLLLGVSVVGR